MSQINYGDIVMVNFNAQCYTLTPSARVCGKPTSQGDSWIVEDTVTGTVHYISEPCTITLIKSKDVA